MTRLLTVGVMLVVAGCTAPTPEPVVDVSIKSSAIADRFQADLQGQLQAAMKAGGPVGAIGVCQQAAPAIAARLSEEGGAEVRRIALRERNPAAAPEGDLRERLEQLAAVPLTSDGKPAVMQWTSGSGADARAHYMRAIPMKEQPCAACHGTAIAPEVKDKLAELYPADKATGFKPGDLVFGSQFGTARGGRRLCVR